MATPGGGMLVAILQSTPADEDPCGLVAKLMDAMPHGSFLVVAHPTADFSPEEAADSIGRYNDQVAVSATLRNREDTVRFFDGLDLVEPGVVATSKWPPDTEQQGASPPPLSAGGRRKAYRRESRTVS